MDPVLRLNVYHVRNNIYFNINVVMLKDENRYTSQDRYLLLKSCAKICENCKVFMSSKEIKVKNIRNSTKKNFN